MGTLQLALALAGEKIVIAGLALQVATFVVFLIASVDFQIRMTRKTSHHTGPTTTFSTSLARLADWKKMLYILYSVSALILFRCTFRLIEYAMGNAGYLIAHEWTLYVFDSVPMFGVLVLLAVLKPSEYVVETRKVSAVRDDGEMGVVGSVERK